MEVVGFLFRVLQFIKKSWLRYGGTFICKTLFLGSNVHFGKGLNSNGVPVVRINRKSNVVIGNAFKMNNGFSFNPIGRNQPCVISVSKEGCLTIGDRVGMSSASIVCAKHVTILDDVKIGGGVAIYDTDFHSLKVIDRMGGKLDKENAKSEPIIINKGAFVGAHSIILKGVSIGENSIIGAGSVVTKSVPSNEIWAGNPARFIRSID